MMKRNLIVALVVLISVAVAGLTAFQLRANGRQGTKSEHRPRLPGSKWYVHDMHRPQPRVMTPGTFSTQETPGRPPSDAIVLFDGKDLSKWQSVNDGPARWKVEDGYFQVVPGTGDIETKEKFGAVQVHLEWSEPTPPHGTSQGRGNSGVFLQGEYEIQVLDSFHNITYPDGQCGAVYGQHPPLVNVCRPPGEWQTYDLVFTPAVWQGGRVRIPPYVTVFQNGVLVQNYAKIYGPTKEAIPHYVPGAIGPLRLQDHHNAVRYRNIWIREIRPE